MKRIVLSVLVSVCVVLMGGCSDEHECTQCTECNNSEVMPDWAIGTWSERNTSGDLENRFSIMEFPEKTGKYVMRWEQGEDNGLMADFVEVDYRGVVWFQWRSDRSMGYFAEVPAQVPGIKHQGVYIGLPTIRPILVNR